MSYAYNLSGTVYHPDPGCGSVTAYDAAVRIALTKSDVPEGRSCCGSCGPVSEAV